MSSYIIAGSADSIDTAYCQEIANRIKAKYKNIDFRIVIKHPTQWEQYLQQICRIYGFLKKSNPIIYTFDGKIIGNKQSFMSATAKYFGLDQQSLSVQNISTQVNMKIATEQINKKHIIQNNIQTLPQKIQSKYQQLLKKGILKHQMKQKKQYLTNGIQYIHRSVKGIVPNISFVKNKEIKVQVQQVQIAQIDLIALSMNDQIKVDQGPTVAAIASLSKDAFVTNNEKNNSEHDKMSEVSRTNKMHQSIVSGDKDSKVLKDSSKSKERIDQENDDVPDYIDQSMQSVVFANLSDDFHVAFVKDSHITGEMIFYHNEDSNGNSLRIHNDNRPVKGHRVLIKEVHFDGENALLQASPSQVIRTDEAIDHQGNVHTNLVQAPALENSISQKIITQEKSQQTHTNQQVHQQNPPATKQKPQQQKVKTEPNLPNLATSKKNIIQQQDAFSQVNSDLNLISHLNFHTLFVQKPLSPIELKNLLHFINATDSISCLQFLSQNPNPKVKLYDRKLLLNTKSNDKMSLLLPVQKFIQKQLQDHQFTQLQVPNQNCYDFESLQNQKRFDLLQINELGYQHYLYMIKQNQSTQTIAKVIKFTIDAMFYLEDQMRKQIGYNLILTKKFLLLIPLTQAYDNYNGNKLYFDGLAYLGFVHMADVVRPYEIKKGTNTNMGSYIRKLLHDSANFKYD